MTKSLNKTVLAVFIFAGTGIIILSLQWVNFFQPMEKTLLDQQFRYFDRETGSDDISLIMIDQRSLNSFIQNHGIYWPWPREIYGVVHHYLMAKGVQLVVYDILFDQPDFDRNGISGEQSDAVLEQMLGTYQNAVLAVQSDPFFENKSGPDISRFSYPVEADHAGDFYGVSNGPMHRFLETARALGSVAIPVQNETVIRSVPLFFNSSENSALPSLGMAAYLNRSPQANAKVEKSANNLHIDSLIVPLQDDGTYLINWYKKSGENGAFKTIPFYSIFEAALQFRMSGDARNDEIIDLGNNLVFIGANAAGLSDIKSTPMSPLEPFPGVEIHATVTQNLLDGDFIHTIPTGIKNLLLLILIATIVSVIFWAPSKINIPVSVLILASILIFGLALFAYFRFWFPTVELLLSSVFAVTVSFSAKYVSEDAQKKAIRNAFNLYVQKELVEQIIEKPEMLKLGGEKKELTVMFSDLAGFTSISENVKPEELVAFLNEYLNEMTQIIFKHKGTVDKFIGDAIMAFWGAPIPEEDHAYLACKCVLEMEEKMKELQQKWLKDGQPAPHVRYGLNSGEMVVGNMGSDDRFNYTVLGDNVNLGARLEPANKDFGTQILITESTQQKVYKRMLTREAALLKAKGKTQPIRVYELLCERSAPQAEHWITFLEFYEKGLNSYHLRKWDVAESAFKAASKLKESDQLTQMYLKNIAEFKQHPPNENWDGSFQQINK